MSKVVFVGNIPYNVGEEQLIEVFKTVGHVVGFRLVYDRGTEKPKGFGFCEFADHETAASAVRNLNGYDVGGRPLRIDLADSDPQLEGKTTVRGELVDTGSREHDPNAFLNTLPTGVPVPPGSNALDMISSTLATLPNRELMDVLAHMKAFVITHPDQARALLVAHPQLAYALFQALVLNKIVDTNILHRMLSATASQAGPPPPPPSLPPRTSANGPTPAPVPQYPPSAPPQAFGYPPPMMAMPPYPGMPPPMFPSSMPPSSMPPYFRPPPAASTSTPPNSATPMQGDSSASFSTPPQNQMPSQMHGVTDEQKNMLMQVLQMQPEQIAALPETERTAIMQLRAQFMPGGG